MAEPIPPEAPVTSAVMPVRSNILISLEVRRPALEKGVYRLVMIRRRMGQRLHRARHFHDLVQFRRLRGAQQPLGHARRVRRIGGDLVRHGRSEEHTSELQSLMRISYAVFCLKKKNQNTRKHYKDKTHTNKL